MTDNIKILSRCSTETIKEALKKCSGSEQAKERALQLIEDNKKIEKEIAKIFGK